MLTDVLSLLRKASSFFIKANRTIRVIIQCLHDIPISICDRIGASQMVCMDDVGGGGTSCPLNYSYEIIACENVFCCGGGVCGIELVYVDRGDASCGLAYAVILMIVAVCAGRSSSPRVHQTISIIPCVAHGAI